MEYQQCRYLLSDTTKLREDIEYDIRILEAD